MGWKANFCCFCCCAKKAKKLTRAVCILFIILSTILCISNGINVSNTTGAYMVGPIISLILNAVVVVFSIIVLIKIGKGAWGMVRGYGIFCLIVNIIALVMTVVSLALYLFAVGVVGSAVQGGTNDSSVTGAVVGFALAIAVIPYTVAFLLHAWFIHLSYKVMKGSAYMEEKEEEKAEEKRENDNYQNYSNPNQDQAYPPQGNPQFQPAEGQGLNDYKA